MDDFKNALGNQLNKPMKRTGDDVAALNGLMAMLNNPAITGAVLPTKEEQVALVAPPAPAPVLPPIKSNAGSNRNLLFFTGRFKVGKDFVAAAAGAKIIGFADPMYELVSHYYGVDVSSTANKDLPGMRETLQTIGQWGRGEVTVKYPLTPARACFTDMIRSQGMSISPNSLVDWANYGRFKNFWLDACLRRVAIYQGENPDARVAITNARFENEFTALKAAGWRHFHVMCSPATWQQRLAKSNMTMESPAVKDMSEAMAASLDAGVTKRVSAQRTGSRLAVIWNDPAQPRISDRLHTLDSFLVSIGAPVQQTNESISFE